jgi:thiol:disulfide interchange protein DsbD
MILKYTRLSILFFSCFLLFTVNSFASRVKPLPVTEAFVFSLSFDKEKNLIASWDIAPHYYLYRKHLNIDAHPTFDHAHIQFPKPTTKQDFTGTSYEVYMDKLSIQVPTKTNSPDFRLSIDYQGCSADGFCYPKIHKDIQIDMKNYAITEIIQGNIKESVLSKESATPLSIRNLLSNQNGIQALLNGKHLMMLLLIFAALGLLLSFTPCVLPMVPILLSIIVGQKNKMSTKDAFFLSLSYVLGGAITYALAGLVAAELGSSLQVWLQKPIFILLVSALFFLLSLSLFGFYELSLPSRLQNQLTLISNQQKSGKLAGVFVMGMISTLILSPCVTAPLVGVLMYVGQTGDIFLAMALLFVMGFAMGVPLLLIGTGAGKWLPKSGPWMTKVKILFGLIMFCVAISLASRVVPTLSISNLFATKNTTDTRGPFILVHDLKDINKNLLLAQSEQKPVILDFYADWCESCVLMDKNVFQKQNIKEALNKYMLLRADLTANTKNDEALLKYFNVVAPPTVLFFDAEGNELNEKRIVGVVDAKEFLARL